MGGGGGHIFLILHMPRPPPPKQQQQQQQQHKNNKNREPSCLPLEEIADTIFADHQLVKTIWFCTVYSDANYNM